MKTKKKRILPTTPKKSVKKRILPIVPNPRINCGIVYTIKNKKDSLPAGFMIGELHDFNFNCPASEFKYFFDYADLFFFEKSVIKEFQSNNTRRKNLLTIPTNYGRYKFKDKGKKKYFLETKKQCKEYSRLIDFYNENEMLIKENEENEENEEMNNYNDIIEIGKKEKVKILSSINNPINTKYFNLIKKKENKKEIQKIYKEGIDMYDKIIEEDLNINGAIDYLYDVLVFIKMFYLNLGINEYFIEENKKDNIEFSEGNKPENTQIGILKKRNKLWMKRIKKILEKPSNIRKKFVIVVGVEHLLLDGGKDGLVKLFEKEGKIVEQISTYETYSYFNQNNNFSFSNERSTEGNNSLYHNISF